MRVGLFVLIILGWYSATFAQMTALEQQLFDLEGVAFKAIETPEGYTDAFELQIKQPIDHQDPSRGYFYQRAYLSHRDFDRPTVICTEGYSRPRNRVYELTDLIEGNQIDVEHRFFGTSMPDSLDYAYLTLEQATADLHRINQLFRTIYAGKWVSTGISKGGQTTIFYRYFYPEDVDVSVPYVAPLNLDLEDRRIYTFLDTVGTAECRAKILGVQQRILQDREESIHALRWFAKGAKLEFSYLDFEQAVEYAVLEYPFSFWQWGGDCDAIPTDTADLETTLDHFLEISGLDFFADGAMTAYASHYYQAGSQMGYYSYETEDLPGLIKALPTQPHPSAIFMPEKIEMTFDGKLVEAVAEWLPVNGDRFIYINGDADTWSATAVRPTEGIDAHWFFLAGKDHGQARIKNMTEEEQQQLEEALEGWLQIEIE